MAFQIVEKESNGVTVLELAGRLVLGEESSQLRNRLRETLEKGKTQVVIDLGEVSYIDSGGLGTLVAGYTSAQNQGVNIKLSNLTKKVSEQLHITKLVTVFEVFDSTDAAVKSFTPAS